MRVVVALAAPRGDGVRRHVVGVGAVVAVAEVEHDAVGGVALRRVVLDLLTARTLLEGVVLDLELDGVGVDALDVEGVLLAGVAGERHGGAVGLDP